MSKLKAFKAISLLWVGSLLGAGFAFVTQVVIARSLGPADLGGVASALATAALFVPIVGFGIGQYWLNAFGQEGWEAIRWSRSSNRLIVVSGILVFFVFVGMAILGGRESSSSRLLMIVLLHVYGQVAIELVSAKLQLEERYSRLAAWQLFPHFSRLILIGSVLYSGLIESSATLVAAIYALVGAILTFIAVSEVRKVGTLALKLKGHDTPRQDLINTLERPSALAVLKGTWPFGMASLFQLIYYQSNIVMIERVLGRHEAGLYNVAFTVMAAVYLLPTVIYQKFLFSKIHRWATQNPKAMYEVFRKGNIAMGGAGMIFTLAIWFMADWGISLLFGSRYLESSSVLKILAFSAPFLFVAFSAGAPLVTKNNMRTKVALMGAVAVFNIIANAVLIPLYRLEGAAIATVLSNVLLMSLYYVYAKRLVFGESAK